MLDDDSSHSTSGEPALFGPDSGDTKALNFEATIEHPIHPPISAKREARPLAFDLGLYGRNNGDDGAEVF
jgi:hypothetical protein